MIGLTVSVDDQMGVAGYLSGLRGQIPFITALSINDTTNQAQSAVQKTLPEEFTLRRESFIKESIYIGPNDRATKDRLSGTVRVNPARNFVAKFEDGGQKTPIGGKALAVPVLRATNKSLIIRQSDPLSLARLMDSIQNRRGRILHPTTRKGVLRVHEDANKIFLVKSAKGTFIIQRIGNVSDGIHSTRVLYAFERSVPIKPVLHFEEVAMATAVERWSPNFNRALDYAVATMFR